VSTIAALFMLESAPSPILALSESSTSLPSLLCCSRYAMYSSFQ
jgi:hypothetical protein